MPRAGEEVGRPVSESGLVQSEDWQRLPGILLHVGCSLTPGIRSPGTGVTGGCKLSDTGAENRT